MIKIESDVLYPSGNVSSNVMLVISCTTCMLIVLVIIRTVMHLQLEIDQRRLYSTTYERDNCCAGLKKLFSCKSHIMSLLI